MTTITVEKVDATHFRVTVSDKGDQTVHEVSATPEQIEHYGGGAQAVALLIASFEFLLQREPKEAILSSFALPTIERYFPEYSREIRKRLA